MPLRRRGRLSKHLSDGPDFHQFVPDSAHEMEGGELRNVCILLSSPFSQRILERSVC